MQLLYESTMKVMRMLHYKSIIGYSIFDLF